jgi:hypothetical protein
MHDIDRTLMEYNPETELMPEAFEYGETEWSGATGVSGVFNETEEMELAAELLSVSNEHELDRFLGGLILRCGKVILVFGPCADVRQANGVTALGPQQAAAR